MIPNGFFITLEGPEGAGKSTQIRLLANKLRQYDVLETREPGGTVLGEKLRQLIKHFDGPEKVTPETELLLFGACRAQLVQHVIRPQLQNGGIVICDRFADSTTVYQGVARGLDSDFIEHMHSFTVGSCWPNLTFLLDLDVDTGFERSFLRNGARDPADRIEAESRAFHQKVRQGFLNLAKQHADRIKVIDASRKPEDVHRQILEITKRAIEKI